MYFAQSPGNGLILAFFLVFTLGSSSVAGDNRVTQSEKIEILTVLISDTDVRSYAQIEIPAERNVTVYNDYISLHLFDNQGFMFGGVRSEVTVNFPYEEHDRVVYEWEFMLPEGFLHDAPENRWWNMGGSTDQISSYVPAFKVL